MEPISVTAGSPSSETSEARSPIIEVRQISKRFGQVIACDSVDLSLRPGQIHGILGENGAGKSTLMKILIGLVAPDSGQLLLDGNPTLIADPVAAAAKGIAMVHQHFSVIEALTVWENVALGDSQRLDPAAIRKDIADLSRHYGLDIEPDAVVGTLSAGLRQRVELIKGLRRQPRLMILDEPTSVLSSQESASLFEALRRVVDEEGMAIALVSHKLKEILRWTDVLTVMRQGRVVHHGPTGEQDAAGLTQAIAGPATASLGGSEPASTGFLSGSEPASPESYSASEPHSEVRALEVSSLSVSSDNGRMLLNNLSLSIRKGEILGLAGAEGNGQRVLSDLFSSLIKADAGQVRVAGAEVRSGVAGAMVRAGLSVIPEDHHDSGSIQEMTVAENLMLDQPFEMASSGILDRARIQERASELIASFAISCEGPGAPMWTLSGGNQQRVVLARAMASNPEVLVAAQPTRGLDIAAISYFHSRLRSAAAAGVAVLLISSEVDEILKLADRIAVISQGSIVGELAGEQMNIKQLSQLLSRDQ